MLVQQIISLYNIQEWEVNYAGKLYISLKILQLKKLLMII